jgi:hypothetical protein
VETIALVEHDRSYHQRLLDELGATARSLGIHVELHLVVGHSARPRTKSCGCEWRRVVPPGGESIRTEFELGKYDEVRALAECA